MNIRKNRREKSKQKRIHKANKLKEKKNKKTYYENFSRRTGNKNAKKDGIEILNRNIKERIRNKVRLSLQLWIQFACAHACGPSLRSVAEPEFNDRVGQVIK